MPNRLRLDSGFSDSFSSEVLSRTNSNFQEKVKYEKEIYRINAAKKSFIKNVLLVYKDIEETIRSIASCIQFREQELKNVFQHLKNKKVLEWDRQLQLCEQASKSIDNVNNTSFEAFDTIVTAHNIFATKIDLIDEGMIDFRSNITYCAHVLEKFGRISCGSGESSEKANLELLNNDGLNDKKFNQPWGVCSDETGQILVVDNGNNRVLVFNECGEFLFHFGEPGSGPGQFAKPAGIATNKKRQIIVCDKNNHRIQIFTFTGKFYDVFGQKGTGPGEFQYPWDVAINEENYLVVSDSGNRRIQILNSHGYFITQFNFTKNLPDLRTEVRPSGVAFRSDGSLLIVDNGNCCVLLMDKNFSKVTVCEFKDSETSWKPHGVACNSHGMFAVAYKNKVQVFDSHGKLSKSLEYNDMYKIGRRALSSEKLNYLQGICFLPDGSIMVSDLRNNRIVLFRFSYVGFEIRQFPRLAVVSLENDWTVKPEPSKDGWKPLNFQKKFKKFSD